MRLVGLGDSSYVKFNWAARKLGKRVGMLGAREVCESVECDEQGDEGIDGTFLAWLEAFRESVVNEVAVDGEKRRGWRTK